MTRFRLLAGLLAKKKKREEIVPTLALPRDPPATGSAGAPRLVFHVAAPSAKGFAEGARIAGFYPLSATIIKRRIRFEFFDKSRSPVARMLLFGGLPALHLHPGSIAK
jgi:hypothetical protein